MSGGQRQSVAIARAILFNAKILIDNQASKPFNFQPSRIQLPKSNELANMIKELSRYKFGRKRALVEAEIAQRREMTAPAGDDAFL